MAEESRRHAINKHISNDPFADYLGAVAQKKLGEVVAKSEDLVYRKREWFVPPEE
jgi:hypothetical protein